MYIHHVPAFVVLNKNVLLSFFGQPQVIQRIFHGEMRSGQIVIAAGDKELEMGVRRHRFAQSLRGVDIPALKLFITPRSNVAGQDLIHSLIDKLQISSHVIVQRRGKRTKDGRTAGIKLIRLARRVSVHTTVSTVEASDRSRWTSQKLFAKSTHRHFQVCRADVFGRQSGQVGILFGDSIKLGSCYISIDCATRDNGCLQVLPRSHHLGRLEHGQVGGQTGADPERIPAILERFETLFVETDPGDGLFFHGNLLHRSDQNRSAHPRWSLICCYNARSNSPYEAKRHNAYVPLEMLNDDQVFAGVPA